MINADDMQSWAYLLAPTFQFINSAGKPLTEGWIEVYIAGTRNKYYCASDFNGTLHPFQIPLDSLGANIVLANPDQAYDVYVYNKFGSLIMSRYHVSPGMTGGSGVLNITIESEDGTVTVNNDGNGNFDLSIKDTVERVEALEQAVSGLSANSSVGYAIAHADTVNLDGTFNLVNDAITGIDYSTNMDGFRLKPGHVYQLNFNSKFTLDDKYNNLVEGKLYLDGDMSFSQDWSFSLDDSFDHIKHINGSTIIVVPDTLQYYDLSLKYTFNSVVNCTVDLENISIVDITSILKDYTQYSAGDGIDITNNIISVDMDYINEQINIDEKLSSAVNIANEYTDNSINTTINEIASATATLEQEIQNIPPQVQSDWTQDDSTQVDYIKNKPDEIELVAGQNIGIFEGISTLIIAASATDLSNCATHDEVYNSSVTAVNSANSYTDTAIANIDFSDYATHNEVYSATSSAIASANSYTDTAISNIDFSDYATHSEVYNSSVTAINSANSYTDTAIANLDLTPAVEIVSPNNTISVSSVVNSANNTKTFYLDTNDPDLNYWIGRANLSLSDQSSQGQVGYYKDVFDYTTKLNGNLDTTKLKKGLYLLTANVMIVADEVNNDLAEVEIQSTSTSAISYTSSVFQHDCSVADTFGEPMDESHQIATIVRVMYDDTPMSLIARMDDPTTVSNELHLWFSDIGLYELKGTSVGSSSSPSASGSYDAGWGIIINGNVISVNPNIIPDISNLASTTYVDNRIASAVNIIESEIPDVSDMATRTWVNSQGYLTSIPSYYTTESEVHTAIATAINSIPEQVNSDWNSTSGKSEILNKPDLSVYSTHAEVYNATVTAINVATANIPSQVQSDWTEDDSTDPSYIQNKPETIDVDVCPIIAGTGISITASGNSAVLSCTVTGTGGENYSAGNGIDITNNTISIDNTVALKSEIPDVSSFITSTQASAIVGAVSSIIENDIPDTSDMATKTWVGQQGYLTSIPSSYATDAEVSSAIATATTDMATKTWVGNQGYLTEIPPQYVTETELSNELSNYALASAIPSQVQSDWTEDDTTEPSYIQNKPDTVDIDVCPIIAGSNITITASGNSAVINSVGGGSTYTAGNGIDITSDVISVDNTIALKTDIPAPVSGASGISVNNSVISLDNPVEMIAGNNITISVSGTSAVIEAQVISVPPTSGLDTSKHYYLTWDNTNGVHWEVGDLGEIETALANL